MRMLTLTSSSVRKKRGLEMVAEAVKEARERRMACLVLICLPCGWHRSKYLSTAISRVENEEQKTQVAWRIIYESLNKSST